jgi:hypothetical protein
MELYAGLNHYSRSTYIAIMDTAFNELTNQNNKLSKYTCSQGVLPPFNG